MRAALYARVSSEEQVEGYSIDAQIRAFYTLCEARGWTPVKEYIEEGKSARTEDIGKRSVFKEMIADALLGKFEVLIVHKLDRFSRNLRITLEYFDKLLKAGVTFVSINEQMDFTTPSGKVHLALLGAFAQYYSDNLSQETKKGWAERRAQGLYCGLLPFAAMKGEDGIPVPHPDTHPGLVLAFELAAQGKSDREVAIALNTAGYRTAGNRGNRPFAKDSVRDMLKNRFYLGELPDGNGGWLKGKHRSFISQELFDRAQAERTKRRHTASNRIRARARTYSLSGLIWCKYCRSKVHIHQNSTGKPRAYCSSKARGFDCESKSTFLEVYEAQIQWYLGNFIVPEDYKGKIIEAQRKLQASYDDTVSRRNTLERRLQKIKELYKWGHMSKGEYLADYNEIQKELETLVTPDDRGKTLQKLAHFLANVADAWKEGTQEQRNKMANVLFEQIWIEDNKVAEVKPRDELRPFFQLSYEEHLQKSNKRPRGDSNPRSPP
jgi:site-specific DNA recombinase